MSDLLRRAVDIMELLRLAGGELGIRDIAERVQLPKSTVQRILSDLVDTEMASQDPATRRYRLGPRTLALGMAYQRGIDLRGVALPHMIQLRDLTGETVGLSVVIGDGMMHVDQVESRAQLRRTFDIGRPLPMWAGAPSRLILGELPDEEARAVLDDHVETGYQPVRPPSADDLLRDVADARTRGHARAIDETIAGVSTLSAPVRGHSGELVAVLSVTGPTARFDDAAMDGAVEPLTGAARRISLQLGAPADQL